MRLLRDTPLKFEASMTLIDRYLTKAPCAEFEGGLRSGVRGALNPLQGPSVSPNVIAHSCS